MTAVWDRVVRFPGYEFKVIDPTTGQSLPSGHDGELCTRGLLRSCRAITRSRRRQRKAIDADGWLHTGDMMTMSDDGMVRFLGRYKEILKVGGENVDPVEVEAFLLRHPALNQVKVVGVPDARLSEVGCACVRVECGSATDGNDDLIEFCRGKLASFKIPRTRCS